MSVKVNILTTYNSPNSLGFVYPLAVNRPLFSKEGVRMEFFDSIVDNISDCDIIFINSKFFRSWHFTKAGELYGVLAGFKKKAHKVIWFDTADSTGTTQFNVMPFVDDYYKSQLLKDRSLYEKNFYGNRIFTDYYNKFFGEDDNAASEREKHMAIHTILRKEDAHKLHLSWNSAMDDWGVYAGNYTLAGLIAKAKVRLPFKMRYNTRFLGPEKNRKIGISARIGLSHTISTVRRQREAIVKVLKDKFGVDTAVLPRNKYISELKNSKIAISPFGLGEISCRDFEVIMNGALLFKQDMSHLETWPPLYVDGETYMAFSWDISDLEDKLREFLKDDEKIARISKNAQRAYEYYLYGDGRMEFCNKVMDILR